MTPTSSQNETSRPPRRVSLILRWFYPHLTGIVTQHRQYGPRLASEGILLEVETLETNESRGSDDEIDQIRIFRHVIEEKPVAALDAALFRSAIARWERTSVYPDAIVLFSVNRLLLPLMAWARHRGIPCLLSCTNFPEPYEGGWLARWKQRLAFSGSIRCFSDIIVYSETLKRAYVRLGAPAKRIGIIPFGVDCNRFRPVRDEEEKRALRRTLGLPEVTPIILFVGSVVERKGADLLLEAWGHLLTEYPQATLVLAGPYGSRETFINDEERRRHEAFNRSIEKSLDALANRHSVIFTGAVSCPEEYFRAADLFVFPSRSEGLGGVVLEAMASGLPSVLTPFEGFPEEEFGKDGVHYQKVGFSSEAIAGAMQRLLRDDQARRQLGMAAREHAVRMLELGKVTKDLSRLLLRAIEGGKR